MLYAPKLDKLEGNLLVIEMTGAPQVRFLLAVLIRRATMNITRIIGAIGCALGLAGPLGAWADAPVMAERTMVSVDPQAHYRAVYDIHSAETAAGVSKGLYYARGLFEAYRKQGVAPGQLDTHLVRMAMPPDFCWWMIPTAWPSMIPLRST